MKSLFASFPVLEIRRGEYLISTDPERLDVDAIYRYLCYESYWATGISRERVARLLSHSLCFGVYHEQAQIGLARVISDFTTFAHLADVFIVRAYQGRGLGKWLVATVLSHPELQTLRKWALDTRDAHGLYEPFGFRLVPEGRHMEYRPDHEQ